MKKLFISLIAILAIAATANAESYRIDDAAIDNLIETAVEVSPLSMSAAVPSALPAAATAVSPSSSNYVAAIVCNFFLGGFGIHRHILGTRPFMWAIYTFTIGGIFGVVPFVDFVMMIIALVDEDYGRYADNDKFIMWA